MNKHICLLLISIVFISCSKLDTENFTPKLPDLGYDPANIKSKIILIEDEFKGEKIVVCGNAKDNYIVSFYREINNKLLKFSTTVAPLPVIMTDNEGNNWDVFGRAVSGPRKGQQLITTQSFMGYWFSIATFFPGTQIYPDSDGGMYFGEIISGTNDWLVPKEEVRSGGVGRDGIPALENPGFAFVNTTDFLSDADLVVGIAAGGSQKAYPHKVLDWHEIVNDKLKELEYAVVYCPLTGTATVWNRTIRSKLTTFGVSGLLYNSNIIPFDRSTNSNWSQLFNSSVWGPLKGTVPEKYRVLETSWSTWKKFFPESQVMNFSTGFNRNYGDYPYGDYKTNDILIFPVKYEDNRLFLKERVHAIIINGKARVYRFKDFVTIQ